jgi:flagellar biosynthesis/type III secretory pathway M-ring protein FliF/YscJ
VNSADWLKLLGAMMVAAMGGGAVVRYLIPSVRRTEAATARKANADADAAQAQAEAVSAQVKANAALSDISKVSASVTAVNDALQAVQSTLRVQREEMKAQREEFSLRDGERVATIKELRGDYRELKTWITEYLHYTREPVREYRASHPDYPDPPEMHGDGS